MSYAQASNDNRVPFIDAEQAGQRCAERAAIASGARCPQSAPEAIDQDRRRDRCSIQRHVPRVGVH
jgi:hypothetical protein